MALVLSDASWRSQNDGLVVPARFGDSFAMWVPRGKYNLSAYSLDPRGRPKVDPVSAIGVKSVTRSSRPGSASVVLRPRGVPFTRSTISESLNHRAAHPGSLHKCPYCSALQFSRTPVLLEKMWSIDRWLATLSNWATAAAFERPRPCLLWTSGDALSAERRTSTSSSASLDAAHAVRCTCASSVTRSASTSERAYAHSPVTRRVRYRTQAATRYS